jgi:hypothetical protein
MPPPPCERVEDARRPVPATGTQASISQTRGGTRTPRSYSSITAARSCSMSSPISWTSSKSPSLNASSRRATRAHASRSASRAAATATTPAGVLCRHGVDRRRPRSRRIAAARRPEDAATSDPRATTVLAPTGSHVRNGGAYGGSYGRSQARHPAVVALEHIRPPGVGRKPLHGDHLKLHHVDSPSVRLLGRAGSRSPSAIRAMASDGQRSRPRTTNAARPGEGSGGAEHRRNGSRESSRNERTTLAREREQGHRGRREVDEPRCYRRCSAWLRGRAGSPIT